MNAADCSTHMKFQNIILIGTSHIAVESLTKIETAFNRHSPDIVAVELCAARLDALLSGNKTRPGWKDIKRIGVKGYLFAMLGAWAERKLGESVGMSPGEDMLKAVNLASQKHIPVALIDQNIEVTLREFSKHLSWTEKWRFIVDITKAAFSRKQSMPFDLRTVPSAKVVKRLTGQVKDRYPNIYRVLVTDRNEYMAKKLAAIMRTEQEKTILAVIGAGHEQDVLTLIKKNLKAHPAPKKKSSPDQKNNDPSMAS